MLLREKKQSDNQRQRAVHVDSLYFEVKQEEARTKVRERYSLGADAGTVAELKVAASTQNQAFLLAED